MKRQQNGFTLIEIMVALAIVAVLGAISVIAYGEYTAKAKAVDIVSQYEALRTRAATVLSNRTVEKCDDVQMMLNGRHPVGSSHAALGYDFVKIADKAYRPVLAVCGKADAGRDAVRVARAAHDSLARQAGAMEKDAVLTDSVVSFAMRLTEGDQAVCRTPVSNPVSPCDASAAARAQAQKAAYDQKKADLQAQQARQAAKQNTQQSLQDKQATHQAVQKQLEDAARARAEIMARKKQSALDHAEAEAKKGRHKEAEAARAAAAAAEKARQDAEAAAQAAAASAAAQPCPDGQIRDSGTHQCRAPNCRQVTVQAPTVQSAATSLGDYNLDPTPPPDAPSLPPESARIDVSANSIRGIKVGAPGSECLVCGDPNKGTGCSDLDFMIAITAVCPDDLPVCSNQIVVGNDLTPRAYYKCVSIAAAMTEYSRPSSNGCVEGSFSVDLVKGATCNYTCYGDLCNQMYPGASTAGKEITVCD